MARHRSGQYEPDDPPTEDQERRWQLAIEGLVEMHASPYLPELIVIPPIHKMGGAIKVWKAQLPDGRIAWVRQDNDHSSLETKYYLPPDIENEVHLMWLIASGFTQAQAREPGFLNGRPPMFAKRLLSITPEKFAELKELAASIRALEQRRSTEQPDA